MGSTRLSKSLHSFIHSLNFKGLWGPIMTIGPVD